MRVLHIDSGREMRGGQWQVWYLLRGLRSRGHEVKLLARLGGPLLGKAVAAGFNARPLSVARVVRWRDWADVIHAHDARSHALASLLFRRGVVVSRRVGFPVGTGVLSRWKYDAADHYIAISQHVAGLLREAGVPQESISVVYDGVPLEPDVGVMRRDNVLAPATSDPMKGSDLAREAARVAGVEIVFSEALRRDLPRASVFVYITRSEGLGSGVLLAMAWGVPVVASRTGGLVEVIENGVNGLLVENTAGAIARGIRELLDDEGLRVRLGRAGCERVRHQFTLDGMVDGTVRVYEKIRA